MGVSSPSQKHYSRDPAKRAGQERGQSRNFRASGCQRHPNRREAWLPPEVPSSLEWEKEPALLRNVFACRQAHRAHSSSPETPWPPGPRCQLCLLSWPSLRSHQSSLILGAKGKWPVLPLASLVGTNAGPDVGKRGRRAGPPGREKGAPTCRSAFLPLSYFKVLSVLKAQNKCLPPAGCLLPLQARFIFPSDGLLCPLFPLSSPASEQILAVSSLAQWSADSLANRAKHHYNH